MEELNRSASRETWHEVALRREKLWDNFLNPYLTVLTEMKARKVPVT